MCATTETYSTILYRHIPYASNPFCAGTCKSTKMRALRCTDSINPFSSDQTFLHQIVWTKKHYNCTELIQKGLLSNKYSE